MGDILDFQTFGQTISIGEVQYIYARNNIVGVRNKWVGGGSAFVAGPDGNGQAIRAPNLHFEITSTSYKSCGVKFKAKFRATGLQDLCSFTDTGGTGFETKLRKNASEFWEVFAATGTSSVVTSVVVAPALDEWFDVEFWLHLHNSLGRFTVHINGSPIADLCLDNIDTIYHAFSQIGRIKINEADIDIIDVIPMGVVEKYVDTDILSQPGRTHRIAALYVTGNGFHTAWAVGAGSGALYEQVDETGVGNGVVDYVNSNVSGARVSFTHQSMPTNETIFAILGVKVSQQESVPPGQYFVMRASYKFLRIGASNYDGGEFLEVANFFNGSDNFGVHGEVWPKNPSNLSSWTTAAVNALQSGSIVHAGSNNWVSQSVIYVLYVTQPTPEPPRISTSLVRFHKGHRLAKTWLVQRTDEVEFAFTDHNRQLEIDGVTYEPAGGFSGSAIRRELMLKEQGQEFLGVITSDAITVDDLRAGRYRDATVIERIVDWRYPWFGDVQRSVYWIGEVTWNERFWKVELNGLAARLQRRRRKIVSRTCGWDLFGPGCLVSATPHTYPGLTVSSVIDRYSFLAGGLGSFADGHFTDGDIVWATGANVGLVSEVRDYVGSNDRIDLYIKTPFPITTSDTFILRAGCNKLPATCRDKFNNLPNFGGFPFVPGRNKAMRGK